MSDLTPATPTASELPAAGLPEATSDQAPALTPEEATAAALAIAVQAAVKEALAAAPAWVKRLGTCKGYSTATQTANVLLDGDTAEVPCMIQVNRPNPGDRVIVEIVPGDVGSVAWIVGKVGGSDDPAGMCKWYPGALTGAPPSGHLICDGTSYSSASYPALATSGCVAVSGDGLTFTTPDLQGRIPIGLPGGTGRISTNTVRGTGGANAMSSGQLPGHNHGTSGMSVSVYDPGHSHGTNAVYQDGSAGAAGGVAVGVGAPSAYIYSNTTGISASISGNTDYAGSGNEFLPPHMAGYWLQKT